VAFELGDGARDCMEGHVVWGFQYNDCH